LTIVLIAIRGNGKHRQLFPYWNGLQVVTAEGTRSNVADALLVLNPTAPSITVGKKTRPRVSATTFERRAAERNYFRSGMALTLLAFSAHP